MNKQNMIIDNNSSNGLFFDIRKMIETSQSFVAVSVNAALTILYWEIGRRINTEILKGKRADYGKEIFAKPSQLSHTSGQMFTWRPE